MTTGDKLHQTLFSLESATAQLKSFVTETNDSQAKKDFSNYAQQLDSITQGLKGRVNFSEQQEPQYRVMQQAQQGSQQSNQQGNQQNQMRQTKMELGQDISTTKRGNQSQRNK